MDSLLAIVLITGVTLIVLGPILILARRKHGPKGTLDGLARLVGGTNPEISSDWTRVTILPEPGQVTIQAFGPGGLVFGRPAPVTINVLNMRVLDSAATSAGTSKPLGRLFTLLEVQTRTALVQVQLLRRDVGKLQAASATASPD